MNNLERAEIYTEMNEVLDSFDEIMENHDVDAQADEAFAEIVDLVERVRSILTED